MDALFLWTGAYALPMAIGFYLSQGKKFGVKELVIVHSVLIISIFLLMLGGAQLHLSLTWYYLALAFLSVAFAYALLGILGIGYGVSSFIQQCCLLLASIVLLPVTGVLLAAFLSALIYAIAHLIDTKGWWWKFPVMLAWGMTSVLLYAWLQQPFLNIALHTIGGSLLIRFGFLLPDVKKGGR